MSQYTFPNLSTTRGSRRHFTGTVHLGEIASSTDGRRVRVQKVEFKPTSRTHWHRHPAEQVLLILDGTCVLKCSGSAATCLRSGESTSIPAHKLHWHGSTPDGPMTHLALILGGDTRWLRPVAEADYEKAMAEARAGEG
jgi:quercetin dioxygenase-like cupin family protein